MARPLSTKPLLRSRAAQLAEYLRSCIARGELTEPLPSTRDWCARLGVGHNTLEAALKILEREGRVQVHPRHGVRLRQAGDRPAGEVLRHPVVRWVYRGGPGWDNSIWAEVFTALSERLGEHGIHLVSERGSAERLRALRDGGERSNQMLVLVNLGEPYQRWFAGFRRSVLLIDVPCPGVRLPFVWNDVEAAVRHAVQHLSRRGFGRVCLVTPHHPGRSPIEERFLEACAQVRPAVRGELAIMPIDLPRQWTGAQRFARRVAGRMGLLLIHPIPAGLLMTALQQRGVSVPGQVEIISMNTMSHGVRIVPPPVYYPYPVDAMARTVARAAARYFETGRLPRLRKRIPLDFVKPQ